MQKGRTADMGRTTSNAAPGEKPHPNAKGAYVCATVIAALQYPAAPWQTTGVPGYLGAWEAHLYRSRTVSIAYLPNCKSMPEIIAATAQPNSAHETQAGIRGDADLRATRSVASINAAATP